MISGLRSLVEGTLSGHVPTVPLPGNRSVVIDDRSSIYYFAIGNLYSVLKGSLFRYLFSRYAFLVSESFTFYHLALVKYMLLSQPRFVVTSIV